MSPIQCKHQNTCRLLLLHSQKHFCYQEQASSEWTRCLQKDIIFGAITIKLLPTSNKSRVSTVLQSLLAFQLRFGEPPFKNMFSYNCWHRTLYHNVTVETAEAISGSVCRRVSSTSGGCRSSKVSQLSRTLPVVWPQWTQIITFLIQQTRVLAFQA